MYLCMYISMYLSSWLRSRSSFSSSSSSPPPIALSSSSLLSECVDVPVAPQTLHRPFPLPNLQQQTTNCRLLLRSCSVVVVVEGRRSCVVVFAQYVHSRTPQKVPSCCYWEVDGCDFRQGCCRRSSHSWFRANTIFGTADIITTGLAWERFYLV